MVADKPGKPDPSLRAQAEALLLAGRAEQAAGRPEQAVELLNKAVRFDQENAPAHHLLGNLHQDFGRPDRAIAAYRRALRHAPGMSAAYNDLGTAYFSKGWLKDAAEAFQRCIELDPDNYRAHENLGSALRGLGNVVLARRSFQRALWIRLAGPLRRLMGRRRPAQKSTRVAAPESILERAFRAYRDGSFAEAEQLCQQQLKSNPGDPTALHIRALVLNQGDKHAEALAILDALAAEGTDTPEFHDARGTSLRGLRRFEEALASYNRALAANSDSVVTRSNICALMVDAGDYAQAEKAARGALDIDANSTAALLNLGVSMLAQDRAREAEAEFRRVLEINPRHVKARLRLSEALRDQDRVAEMRAELDKVRELDPDNPDLLLHLGLLSQDVDGNLQAALAHFHEAQRIAPNHPGPFFNEALLRLLDGNFSRETWDLYEQRKRLPDRMDGYRKVTLPEWEGTTTAPGELLVYGEQGLGDEIMFSSMLPQTLERAPRLRLVAPPRLVSLFQRSFPGAEVVAWDRNTGAPDPGGATRAVAIGSLGRFFRCSRDDFPQHQGYLHADPARVARFRDRLAALGPGRKIGISWRGGVPLTWRSRRSLTLDDLKPLLGRSDCKFINLQYGDVGKEIAQFSAASGVRIETLHDATEDFEDAAALVAALDRVISICNTTVHLAGALGRPAWVLSPSAPEWRYGLIGRLMVWYPSVEVFRQPRHGDWASVFAEINARLDSNP